MRRQTIAAFDSCRSTVLQLLRSAPDDPDRFAAIVMQTIEREGAAAWERCVECAGQHGVLGVIDGRLAGSANRLPVDIAAAMERRHAVAELLQAHQLTELETVVGALDSAGISVCALKGPALAARFYPQGTTRPSVDLDLLVAEHDLDRAIDALRASGYTADASPSALYLRAHGHHVHLSPSRRSATTIELHFRAYAGFGVVLPAELMLERAARHELPGGSAVLVPSPEDEFLYLAVHAAGHSFIRLVWLYDLKLLLRKHNDLNWDDVVIRARDGGVERAVAYALRVLKAWLEMPVTALPARFDRRDVRGRIADRLLAEVSTPQAVSVRDNLGGLLFTSLLCDRAASGATLVQHHVLRSVRRRLKRTAPAWLPDRWSA